jgi:hypothetical protein
LAANVLFREPISGHGFGAASDVPVAWVRGSELVADLVVAFHDCLALQTASHQSQIFCFALAMATSTQARSQAVGKSVHQSL